MKAVITILFGLISLVVRSQDNTDSIENAKMSKIHPKWVYYKLADTVSGEVVSSEKTPCGCGVLACAALTIVNLGKDTIRILDLCNGNEYSKDQKVKVVHRDTPSFDVRLPVTYILQGTDNKKGTPKKPMEYDSQMFDMYDATVAKTTWGHIIAN